MPGRAEFALHRGLARRDQGCGGGILPDGAGSLSFACSVFDSYFGLRRGREEPAAPRRRGMGKEKEAEVYIARLPEGTKIDPNSMLNVGIKLYNDKDLNGALERFDRVVKENPTLANAYYYRGLTYLGLNKAAEAKADFQKALELEPNGPNADEIREYIKEL